MAVTWFIRICFMILGAAVVIAAIYWIRNFLSKEKTSRAIVKQRVKKVFPLSYGAMRKDRADCSITFVLLDDEEKKDGEKETEGEEEEEQKELTFDVKEKMYDRLPTGTVGVLTWKGDWLKSFRIQHLPKDYKKKKEERDFISDYDL